jgi:hypothetical protein
LCTLPDDHVLASQWDTGTSALRWAILRPLTWFGLVEEDWLDPEKRRIGDPKRYRKTALFDRLLSFDMKLERTAEPRH